MIQNRQAVLDALRSDAATLRRLGVRRLSLFGSALRDDLGEGSDLDFLVELERKTFDAYMDVKEYLEDRFDRPIDLVLRSALKLELRDHILSEAVDAPIGERPLE